MSSLSGEIAGVIFSYIAMALIIMTRVYYFVYAAQINKSYRVYNLLVAKTYGADFRFGNESPFLEKTADKLSEWFSKAYNKIKELLPKKAEAAAEVQQEKENDSTSDDSS